jgi:hypothetical protein
MQHNKNLKDIQDTQFDESEYTTTDIDSDGNMLSPVISFSHPGSNSAHPLGSFPKTCLR